MTSLTRTFVGLGLAALAGGCGTAISADEEQLATDGTEAMTASSQSTAMANVVFESVSTTDAAMATEQLANPAVLLGASCVSRTKDPTTPNVVHVTLDDCTGPFGLVHIDGEEVVTFSSVDGKLHADIVGVGLTANGHPIACAASADITASGPLRRVAWEGDWTRTNDAGEHIVHASDLNISADMASGCARSEGSAVTHVADREVDTAVTGYTLCRSVTTGAMGCPSGTVTHTGKVSGKTVTITFDNTDTAEVTGPRGHTFDVPLVCTAISG